MYYVFYNVMDVNIKSNFQLWWDLLIVSLMNKISIILFMLLLKTSSL